MAWFKNMTIEEKIAWFKRDYPWVFENNDNNPSEKLSENAGGDR
jgi:hypothetical protein